MTINFVRVLLCGVTAVMGIATAALTGTGVYVPPDYNSFQPPVVGGSYTDPVFGTTVKRISNALATPNADRGGTLTWVTDEYSTMSPFNNDNSRILLLHQSYFGLYDGTGVYLRDLPLEIGASSEPRWSRKDNHTIYYVRGNQLKTYDTASGAVSVVHTFSEYTAISGKGEADISLDGDHFVFAGDGRQVFVYEISTDRKSPVFDTAGRSFDSVYITPDNNVTLTWNQAGSVRYTGIELFSRDMVFQRQLARAGGHMDVTRDTDGSEVLVWTNSNDPQPICNNGIVKIRMADGQQTCLVSFDWSLAVHVSAPDNKGFAYVETYAPGNPAPPSGWTAYTNELMQVKLDGSEVQRLTHYRSRPWNSYNWQPKVSTSRDGSRVVYNSNYDLQATAGLPAEYSDVYLMVLDNASVPAPAPTPAPAPPPAPAPAPDTPTAPVPTSTPTVARLEQDKPAIQSTGPWFRINGAAYSGGSAVQAMDPGAQVQLAFTGTGVKWIGYRDPWSGVAKVYLDGVLKATIDTYSSATQAQAVIYSVSGLANTAHNLRLVVTSRRKVTTAASKSRTIYGDWVWVDAFDVTAVVPTEATTVSTAPAPSPTPV